MSAPVVSMRTEQILALLTSLKKGDVKISHYDFGSTVLTPVAAVTIGGVPSELLAVAVGEMAELIIHQQERIDRQVVIIDQRNAEIQRLEAKRMPAPDLAERARQLAAEAAEIAAQIGRIKRK